METHLCSEKVVTTEETIKELILGRNRKEDSFSCGGCSKSFQTICVLHYHCMMHSNGGSYVFDHVTQTAFPKMDLVCTFTQVDEDLIKTDLDRETVDEVNDKVMMSAARDINKQSLDKSSELQDSYINTSFLNTESHRNDLSSEASRNNINDINAEANETEVNTEASLNDLSFQIVNKNKHAKNIEATANNIELNEYEFTSGQNQVNPTNYNQDGQKESFEFDNSDLENIIVTVKNIEKTEDGLFSFEMDEKDAYLFDKTAESIMDRIRNEGEEWISSGVEFQIVVPVNRTEQGGGDSTAVSKDKSQNITVEKLDEVTHNKTETFEHIEEGIIDISEDINDSTKDKNVAKRRRGRPSKKKTDINISVHTSHNDDIEAQLEETVESESESCTNSRRSGRKRKVSSRLQDTDWETPGKVRQKHAYDLCHISKKEENDPKPGKVKDSKLTRTKPGNVCVEIKEENDVVSLKSDDLGPVSSITDTISIASLHDNLVKSETEKDLDQMTEEINANTYSADFSASEVLLSLSKANKDGVEEIDIDDSNGKQRKEKESVLDSHDKPKKGRPKKSLKSSTKCKTKWQRSKGDNFVDGMNEEGNDELPPSKRRDYVCPTCGKIGNLAMMKYHQQCHSTEKPFTCEVCGKGFKTKPVLVAHVRQHQEHKFKCDHCPASFYRKQFLTSHLLTHTGELPYVCKICNKGFREPYILRRHNNNVHENIRNFPCDICNQTFFRPETRNHHRIRHFEPTLKCHHCTKMFKAELDRRKHELTHTGEKLFFCPKCKNGFSQLWPYYRHMWKKHNIGKEEAKEIKIRNKNICAMKNINIKLDDDSQGQVEGDDDDNDEDKQAVEFNIEIVDSKDMVEDNHESVNIIYGNKLTADGLDVDISQFKDGQIVMQQGDESVTQSNEMVVQSTDDLVVQSTSDATDLKGIYDHLYVTDAANVANAIQVLAGNLPMDEGTVIMETREEHPDTGDVSIVQQNIVILSDYSGMEGGYAEIDGYTKEYSTLDI